ncbi:tRNA (adenine(58)-N(1))-methyltransferase non-catalytic subunit TRM6 [Chironomus tepperi]|uniref:tRNA (adenine(58)-N(1))-methyltransferase non-catalytic subunit TRM6 n=1 Tax=Chironomus tepperi TaxID=113505 RepID=UPI00391F09F7
MSDKVQVGQYIIVQRQNYTKLHKFDKLESQITLGREIIQLRNIEGANFFQTFKMKFKQSGKKRLYELELCDSAADVKEILKSMESGSDNRNIVDDGKSQTLSNDEVLSLRETKADSKEIIETIIANSKSFNEKTEYSQEKYIKKKEKKYFEFVQIRKPTIRLLAEIFYRQDPEKALGLRIDSLSQLISYSGINPTGNYLLYESGTSGLVPAAFLNSMGEVGNAQLIHMHPGNFPQKQAIFALNLSEEQLKKCISVNIYSVLRQFYQGPAELPEVLDSENADAETRKRKHENGNDDESEENPSKRANLETEDAPVKPAESKFQQREKERNLKKQKWQEENEEALKVLRNKVDSLTIVSKEDPVPILKELLPFVNPGRPVVLFHTCKEILMECYSAVKAMSGLINVRLTTNFMRNYQVLPMRTHPAVQIQGSSGWILTGYTIDPRNSE